MIELNLILALNLHWDKICSSIWGKMWRFIERKLMSTFCNNPTDELRFEQKFFADERDFSNTTLKLRSDILFGIKYIAESLTLN